MRKGSLGLGSIAGIGLYIHWTFLILIGYVAFTTWQFGWVAVLETIGLVLCVFVCVMLHELGHALTAKRYGIDTTDITMLPIGGLARLTRIPEDPKQELAVAIAGPAVNVAIALVLFLVLLLSGGLSGITIDGNGDLQAPFLGSLLIANIGLVLFNMIPAFPMDGGRVFRALLSMRINRVKATKIAAVVGQVIAVGFCAWGIMMMQPFLILIAVFVFFGARMEASTVATNAQMHGYKVVNAMRTKFPVLQAGDTITKAVQELLAGGDKDFVVMDGEHFAGLLTRSVLMQAITEGRNDIAIGVITDRDVVTVSPGEKLQDAQEILAGSGQGFLPVIDNGKLLGVVDAENILEFIALREAAGK